MVPILNPGTPADSQAIACCQAVRVGNYYSEDQEEVLRYIAEVAPWWLVKSRTTAWSCACIFLCLWYDTFHLESSSHGMLPFRSFHKVSTICHTISFCQSVMSSSHFPLHFKLKRFIPACWPIANGFARAARSWRKRMAFPGWNKRPDYGPPGYYLFVLVRGAYLLVQLFDKSEQENYILYPTDSM